MDYKEKVIALLKSKELSKEQKEKLENIFPELKESEDEKVRKEIVRFIQMEVEDEIVGNKWLAWLGKQGEQKHALSEEDEEHIDSLLKRLYGLCRNEFERTRFAINEDMDWLKSLKQRIGW